MLNCIFNLGRMSLGRNTLILGTHCPGFAKDREKRHSPATDTVPARCTKIGET